MWNPFRRNAAEEPFPKPKWPPIHPRAQAVIAECQVAAAARGVRLELRKSVV